MTEQNNTSDILLARLAEGLDSTAKMTQALLSDLRESEADFAAVKAELNILKENVKGLSSIVREGDGTSSILTRVALIEQSIETIKKWMDSHVDIHQRVKKDISDVRVQFGEIETRLSAMEKTLREIEDREKEEARQKRASIDREVDLAHEKKKADQKVKADRQSALIKFAAAVMIGVIGLAGGYLANSCASQKDTGTQQVPAQVTSPSSKTQ